MSEHFCQIHQSKFYRNEKIGPTGQKKIWYSHKLLGGQGFCVEKEPFSESTHHDIYVPKKQFSSSPQDMFACNAMNNAVALAVSGKIELDQIGKYFQKILAELNQATNN